MNANDLKAEMVWLNSSEAKQRGAAAKAYAISEFKKAFPKRKYVKVRSTS